MRPVVFSNGWPCMNCRDHAIVTYLGFKWCAFHATLFLGDSPALDYRETA